MNWIIKASELDGANEMIAETIFLYSCHVNSISYRYLVTIRIQVTPTLLFSQTRHLIWSRKGKGTRDTDCAPASSRLWVFLPPWVENITPFNTQGVGMMIPIYLWGTRPGALRMTIIGGNPRSVLCVPSVLSLCDSKVLASNLSVNGLNLVFTEAVWMPPSLWGISDGPVPGPEEPFPLEQVHFWSSLALVCPKQPPITSQPGYNILIKQQICKACSLA